MLEETQADQERMQKTLRTLQIIVLALMLGVVTFFVISLIVSQTREPRAPGTQPLLSWLACGFFALQIPIWWFLPPVIARNQIAGIAQGKWPPAGMQVDSDSDVAKLLAVYQTGTIISAALMEGVAFFGLIAFLVEGEMIALVAAGGAFLFLGATFPTQVKLRQWLEAHDPMLEEARKTSA